MHSEIIKEFLKKNNVFTVVGVSSSPEKWGYKVYKDLKGAGYKVYPINPKLNKINGDKCYANLHQLPEKPDVVVTVVPPKVTWKIIEEAAELGIKKIWMQPGSESEEIIEKAEKLGLTLMHGICIMVTRAKLSDQSQISF